MWRRRPMDEQERIPSMHADQSMFGESTTAAVAVSLMRAIGRKSAAERVVTLRLAKAGHELVKNMAENNTEPKLEADEVLTLGKLKAYLGASIEAEDDNLPSTVEAVLRVAYALGKLAIRGKENGDG